eukprot:07849.XXX_152930_153079_1 [CDS] Oithona nana genome sequencing.
MVPKTTKRPMPTPKTMGQLAANLSMAPWALEDILVIACDFVFSEIEAME